MNARLIALSVLLLLVAASSAWGQDPERFAMAHVRLSTDPSIGAGCARMGRVSDDSVKDLRRKIVRAGGNTAVISFAADDLSVILADVFRCTPATSRPAGVPPPPPGSPPPPPPPAGTAPAPPTGAPPPPPPGPSR